MTIATVCAAIAALGNANTGTLGITAAEDPPPATLDTAKLPLLYTFTGPAQYTDLGDDFVIETRDYRVQVAVLPFGEASPQLREARVRPILVAVRTLYFSYPALGGVVGVQSALPLGDSGVVILPEWGGNYIGFELRLQVIEYAPRSFAEGE
jgi:hypothetical protein